jgi:hypothetical protein
VVDEWHELIGSKRGVLMELALSRLKGICPSLKVWGISATIGKVFGFIKSPIKFAESTPFGPVVEIGIGFVHTASEIGVTLLNSIGPAVGGPVGMAVVLPITMFIALSSSALAVAEGDLGQAVVHVVNALPVVGQPLVKFITKGESMNRRVQRMSARVKRIPFIGETLANISPRVGGRTRRRRLY